MIHVSRITRVALMLAPACAAGPALAGEIGPTSRATATITLTIAPHLEVRSTGIAGPESPAGGLRSYGFCVSANTPGRAYGLSLEPGAAPPPPLEWAGTSDRAGAVPIPAGQVIDGFTASARPCSAGSPATATLIEAPAPEAGRGSPSQATLLIVPE